VQAKDSPLEGPIRERILAAARDLFLREGFEGVSVRRIAERAGCSPGMLYHFFTSKELLLARLVERTFEKLDERMARHAVAGGDALRRLQQTLNAYVEFGFEHPHEYFFLFAHGHGQMAPDLLSVFETRGIACFRRIRVLCEEAKAERLLRTEIGSPDETAQALWASIHGLIHLCHSAEGFPFAARKRLARQQVEILIAGLRKAEAPGTDDKLNPG
jgi:AcrR family transcriptional regulator